MEGSILRILKPAVLLCALMIPVAFDAHAEPGASVVAAAKSAEKELGARVGFVVVDSRDDTVWSYRGDERFPMASTFKTLACAALLAAPKDMAAQIVTVNNDELVDYSPVTEKLVGVETPVMELCAATLRTSDNTAANKVLEVLGGPQNVTAFLRSIGDTTTRLDRPEPTVNEATPGDERDTTTPLAMAKTLRSLMLGTALDDNGRQILKEWMLANEVGGPLLRAGVPADWRLADRTGAGGHGTRAVTAIIWPPNREPLIVAVYMTGTKASMEQRNVAIASIGRAIAMEIYGQ
ncbi:class A beta-lactamase [Rhizobium sp.]